MTAVTLTRPRPPGRDRGRPAPSLFDDVGGEPTLDEVLAGVWEGLAARRPVPCPLCGEDMRPEYGAPGQGPDDPPADRTGAAGHHASRVPEGGRCGGCDTVLS